MKKIEDWIGDICMSIVVFLFLAALFVPPILIATSEPTKYTITITRPDGAVAEQREVCRRGPLRISTEWGGQTAIYSEGIIAPVGWMLTVTPAAESP